MNWKTWLTVLAAAASLTACGGGGGAGTPLYGGSSNTPTTTTSTASAVDVSSSSLQLGSGAGESVTITVVVKGAGSVVLPDTAVTLQASSGSLAVAATKTDSSGMVTATLTPGTNASDKANRTIRVSATSGNASGYVDVQVTGTTVAYSGATSFSAGAAASNMSLLVKDSKGAVVPGATVNVTAGTLGNALSALSATTDSNGSATFSYTPTNAGTDSLIFSALGATTTATLVISGQDFVFTSPASGTSVTVGAPTSISVRYRLNGAAVSGATVNFAATAGTLTAATATTNGSGVATTSLTSTFAGATTVTATISGVGTISLPISYVATTPSSVVLQVSPSAIAPNTNGSVAQQSTVSARVTDVNGNPVKGVTVDFSRTADPSIGDLSAPSATTDTNGEASVKYISGPNSTATDGVKIRGTVSGTSIFGDTQLTVNQQALFIALGTSNTISNLTVNGVVDETTYVKPWTVYVTDANGVAVSGKTLTIRILSVAYGKGQLAFSSTDGVWEASNYTGAIDVNTVMPAGNILWCASEDANSNGTLDSGEDTNSSGSLEPGNVISLAPGNSTVTTDANGRATINLLYAESYAPWVQVTLRATATVAGTESKRDATFVVSGMSSDFNKADTAPAGVVSPFGRRASCASPF